MSSGSKEQGKTSFIASTAAAVYYGEFFPESSHRCNDFYWRVYRIQHIEVPMTSKIMSPILNTAAKMYSRVALPNKKDYDNFDKATHDCVEIGLYCFKCSKFFSITYDLSLGGKRKKFGYYENVASHKHCETILLPYSKVKEKFGLMWERYSLFSENCKNWANDFCTSLKKVEGEEYIKNSIHTDYVKNITEMLEYLVKFAPLLPIHRSIISGLRDKINELILLLKKYESVDHLLFGLNKIIEFITPEFCHSHRNHVEKMLITLTEFFSDIIYNFGIFEFTIEIISNVLKSHISIHKFERFKSSLFGFARKLINHDIITCCDKLSICLKDFLLEYQENYCKEPLLHKYRRENECKTCLFHETHSKNECQMKRKYSLGIYKITDLNVIRAINFKLSSDQILSMHARLVCTNKDTKNYCITLEEILDKGCGNWF